MGSKFSRRPRVQPTPSICKKGPLLKAPDVPIDELQSYVIWRAVTGFGELVDIRAPLTLTRVFLFGADYFHGWHIETPWSVHFIALHWHGEPTWLCILELWDSGAFLWQIAAEAPWRHDAPYDSGPIPFAAIPHECDYATARFLV